MINDTICAISTPNGNSGIGIIRVSGDDAISKVDLIFKGSTSLSESKTYTAHYGHIVYDDEIIDEVITIVMRAPNTYTREDVVEIDAHGGALLLSKIMDILISIGVRIADPGEFTKRAFLNGRIDLSQAESIMDIISSKSGIALNNSMRQLSGSVSKRVLEIRDRLIYEASYIESSLDDPDAISIDEHMDELISVIDKSIEDIDYLIKTSDNGIILKEGINTVIVGKPNAGKSSVLNLIAGKERSIVTDIAGTTRDIIIESVNVDGIALNIYDTAGIRESDDVVEGIGIKRALESLDEADLVLYVIDRSDELNSDDDLIIENIATKRVIVLLNKSDLNEDSVDKYISKLDRISDYRIIEFSAINEIGIDNLRDIIKDMFISGDIDNSSDVIITNKRHKELLIRSVESLRNVKNSIESGLSEDFYTIDMMDSYKYLGRIVGMEVEDDLVDTIFSKFCMGK